VVLSNCPAASALQDVPLLLGDAGITSHGVVKLEFEPARDGTTTCRVTCADPTTRDRLLARLGGPPEPSHVRVSMNM
jgi:hypothetical protein